MKVSHDGTTPIYSTLFGGSISEGIYDLEMTDDGDLVFTGLTYSTDLPTTIGMANTSHIGGADIFLTQMDINCTIVKKCTYLGSDGYEKPLFLDIDPNGRITIMGATASSTFPVTPDAVISTNQGSSVSFLMTVLADWSGIQYATYLGGGLFDTEAGVGTDDRGQVYAVGSTDNANFPTTAGSFDTTNNGFEDVYVLSISLDTPPTPPRDLQARAGDNFVDLTWNIPTSSGSLDLTGYDIYKGEEPLSKSLLTSLGEVLQYNDTDVENGKTYYYHIRAKNSALDSIPSMEVQATPMGIPSTPLNFQALGGYMKVDLSWMIPEMDGGTPLLGYHVFRINDHIEVMITLDPSETQYTDEAVQAGVEYEYNINAFNLVGESLVGDPVKATPVSEPTSPMNLSLRSGDGFVEISWQPPQSNGGMILREYNIYRGIDGGELTLLKNMGANVRKYNDTTVHNGLRYEYNVVAVNIIGESLPTEILQTTPMTIPGAPLNFDVTAGDVEVILSWEEPITDGGSEITGYRIRKTAGEEEPEIIDVDHEPGYIDADADVINGITYTYSISAVNSVDLSPWTGEIQVIPASVPGSPTVNVRSYSVDHVHITWEVPTLLGGAELLAYEVYRGSSSQDLSLVASLGSDTLNYNDTNVMIGNLYFYTVKSSNRVGASPVQETVSAWAIGVPTAPRDVSLEMGDGMITISWAAPESDGGRDITGYTIHREDTLAGTTTDLFEDGITLTYTDDSVTPGSTYEYTVTANNEVGTGLASESIQGIAYRAPSGIQGLRADFTNDVVELAWDALDLSETGEVMIEIRRSIDQGEMVTIAILEGTETSFSDSNIREGAVYTYTIAAYNDAGTAQTVNQEIDTTIDVSPGINTAGVAIMVLGTLIPLIIAGILIFLLIKSRREEEPDKEEPITQVAPQDEVTEDMSGTPPQIPQQDVVPPLPAPGTEPQIQHIPQESEPVVEEQQIPVQEEIPLQEEPNPFLDPPVEQSIPPVNDPSKEVVQ
jgi:fibronectin type 3 domain-containing protein